MYFKRILSNFIGVGLSRQVKPGDRFVWDVASDEGRAMYASLQCGEGELSFSVTEGALGLSSGSGSVVLAFTVDSNEKLSEVSGLLSKGRRRDKVGLLAQFYNLVKGVQYEKSE